MQNFLPSLLRTVVPLVVAAILGVGVFSGIDSVALAQLVTTIVTALYYVGVRLLEKVNSKFGWLLGYASQPRYADTGTESLVQSKPNLDLQLKIVSTYDGKHEKE